MRPVPSVYTHPSVTLLGMPLLRGGVLDRRGAGLFGHPLGAAEQLERFVRHVLGGYAKVLEHRLTRRRGAEALDADGGSLEAYITLPA